MQKNYPGKVQFVFRDFPLGFHDRAIPAAVQAGPGAALFDFVARAMVEAGVRAGDVVGFTFSYPTRQRALAAGELIEWTKGFSAPGVVGADVIRLLDDALDTAPSPWYVHVVC